MMASLSLPASIFPSLTTARCIRSASCWAERAAPLEYFKLSNTAQMVLWRVGRLSLNMHTNRRVSKGENDGILFYGNARVSHGRRSRLDITRLSVQVSLRRPAHRQRLFSKRSRRGLDFTYTSAS
jgi:hypothetical protein